VIEVYGDLWTYKADIRIITTNGTVNSKGRAVMGRGCAKEAADRYPELPYELAAHIKTEGNVVGEFPQYSLITFPVKHNWWEQDNRYLIHTSGIQLLPLIDPQKTYCMVSPDETQGRLQYGIIKSLVKDLPDNVAMIIADNPQTVQLLSASV